MQCCCWNAKEKKYRYFFRIEEVYVLKELAKFWHLEKNSFCQKLKGLPSCQEALSGISNVCCIKIKLPRHAELIINDYKISAILLCFKTTTLMGGRSHFMKWKKTRRIVNVIDKKPPYCVWDYWRDINRQSAKKDKNALESPFKISLQRPTCHNLSTVQPLKRNLLLVSSSKCIQRKNGTCIKIRFWTWEQQFIHKNTKELAWTYTMTCTPFEHEVTEGPCVHI